MPNLHIDTSKGISQNYHPRLVVIALHDCTIPLSRVELKMRRDVYRLPAAPYAKQATVGLSWHKLMFDHVKIHVFQQGFLGHNRVATSLCKFNTIKDFKHNTLLSFPLTNIKNKEEIIGEIHLRLDFYYDDNLTTGLTTGDALATSLTTGDALATSFTTGDALSANSIEQVESPLSPYYSLGSPTSPSSASISSASSRRSISSSLSSLVVSEKTQNGFKELSDLIAAFKSTGWNSISKTDFARGLLFLLDYYKKYPIPRTHKVVDDTESLRVAAYFMDFCLPSYGAAALNYFGYGNGLSDFFKSKPDLQATMDHLNLAPEDILVWQYGNPELFKANFFACHDRKTNSIIVSVRGTFNFHEALLDTHVEYHPFLGGHGHKGMVKTAELLEEKYLGSILGWIKERECKALYLVGHSLGAAITAIFMLKTRPMVLEVLGQDFTYEAYNFATPPCLSEDLCNDAWFIKHYINENDIVPHVSFGAIMDMRELIVKGAELSQSRVLSKEDKLAELHAFKVELRKQDKHPRISVPGKHYFMYKTTRIHHHTSKGARKKGFVYHKTGNPYIDHHEPHYVIEETEPSYFEDLDIRPNLIWHHLLNKYDGALRKAHDWMVDFKANPNSPMSSSSAYMSSTE